MNLCRCSPSEGPESVLLVALDDDAEDIQNRIPVSIECASGNGNPFTCIRFEPALVYFLQRDSVLRLVDGVYQPDVLLKECVGFHNYMIKRILPSDLQNVSG